MKISIITASYNYAEYLEDAIKSVINQSYADWELIIVDDGSSDNSLEIIKKYYEIDGRIKLYQHENHQNKGLTETIKYGISKATGDWIAFLESDDYFSPDNLLKKVAIIKKEPNVKLIFNQVKFLYSEEDKPNLELKLKRFNKKQKELANKSYPRNMFKDFYRNNSILTFSCVMVQSKELQTANFEAPVDSMLDWWLWIHLAYKNDFYFLNEELTCWRLHSKSYIASIPKKIINPVPIYAYNDVYRQQGKPLKLLVFIIFSFIKLCTIKFHLFFYRRIILHK